MDTILVLTGVTRRQDISRFPYQPTLVFDSVADIELEEKK
jgi:NagD protein